MNKQELLSKLKAAETGSPELSADCFKFFYPECSGWKLYPSFTVNSIKRFFLADPCGNGDHVYFPALSQSIDDAVQAVEDAGLSWNVERIGGCAEVAVFNGNELWLDYSKGILNPECVYFFGMHKSAPIAICIALIEATEER